MDEDTGKIILEYIHGGLEVVEPNILQEALLAKMKETASGSFLKSSITTQ